MTVSCPVYVLLPLLPYSLPVLSPECDREANIRGSATHSKEKWQADKDLAPSAGQKQSVLTNNDPLLTYIRTSSEPLNCQFQKLSKFHIISFLTINLVVQAKHIN